LCENSYNLNMLIFSQSGDGGVFNEKKVGHDRQWDGGRTLY